MIVHCTFCRMQLDPDAPSTLRRVRGWEKRAIAGSRRGGSDVLLREPVGEVFACSPCVDALKNGRSPSQGALL